MPHHSSERNYIHGFSISEPPRLVEQAAVLAPAVFEGINLNKTANLLEIGCGVGAQTKHILRHWPHLYIHCIDINIDPLLSAADYLRDEIAGDQVSVTAADAENLPYEDNTFDAALTIWMLEHAQSPEKIFSEMHRVLKTGGRILLTEVDNSTFGFTPENTVIEGWWQKFNACQERGGSDPYIGQNLKRIARDTGFSDINEEVLDIVSSSREPQRRVELLRYLCDLLLSGAESMKRHGFISDEDKDKLKEEFISLESKPQINFLYQAVRLIACKP